MARVMMISDTHFGHENIPKFRQVFSSRLEHDEFLFNSIMDTVNKRDQLWILGDVCFTMEAFNNYIVPISKRVDRLKILLGNHDAERSGAPTVRDYLDNNIEVHGLVKYKKAWLSHAPMHESELRGKFNIHGHTHFATVNDPRYVNVCCEQVAYRPVNYQEILDHVKRVH